jgi:uncharacterized integral membrane protein
MDETPQAEPAPAPSPPQRSPSDSGISLGLVVFLLFTALFVVFIVQNSESVPIRFLNWEGSFPLPLILVVTALVAVMADELFGVLRRRRRRRRLAEREELDRYRRT